VTDLTTYNTTSICRGA